MGFIAEREGPISSDNIRDRFELVGFLFDCVCLDTVAPPASHFLTQFNHGYL